MLRYGRLFIADHGGLPITTRMSKFRCRSMRSLLRGNIAASIGLSLPADSNVSVRTMLGKGSYSSAPRSACSWYAASMLTAAM